MRGAVLTIGLAAGALGLAAAQAQAPAPATGGTAMVSGAYDGSPGPDTLVGGPGAVAIRGGAGADSILGAEAPDVINGNVGTDTVDGGTGPDSVYGGRDGDSLSGGAGDDLVSGDLDADTLSGGLGADLFTFEADSGADVITDFASAEGDRLRFPVGAAPTAGDAGADTIIQLGASQVRLAGVTAATLGTWLYEPPVQSAPERSRSVGVILWVALAIALVTFVMLAVRTLRRRRG